MRAASAFCARLSLVAGVDEAGRGCLAGPVVAAAVILKPGPLPAELAGLDDSKALSKQRRDALEPLIKAHCLAFAYGLVRAADIDRINILAASLKAMSLAVLRLRQRPEGLLVDGDKTVPQSRFDPAAYAPKQLAVVDGDALLPAISAASVLAKTQRDRLMGILDRHFPGYGLAEHKGYATKTHRQAIEKLGPTPLHRLTFRGVREHTPQELLQDLPGQDRQAWLI